MNEHKAATVSAFWYVGVSLALALTFFLLTGSYTKVAGMGARLRSLS